MLIWLIDANIDPKLYKVLDQHGIKAESSKFHGVTALSNGKLLDWAISNNFCGIITQDRDYHKDSNFTENHNFCIVILALPNNIPQRDLLDWVDNQLLISKFKCTPGKLIWWPENP
jgi:predicted nuclease of predicted toxin-antitoxin system